MTTPQWREGDPIAVILVGSETCYEYADGSIRRNKGGGLWVKLTAAERDEIAELPRVSLVPQELDDYLQGMSPGMRRRTHILSAGPCPCECNSGGFCGGCGHAGCGLR